MPGPASVSPPCASVCPAPCAAVQRAQLLPPAQRRRKGGYASLAALLTPGLLFGAGLAWLARDPIHAWLGQPLRWPWELWAIALAGIMATLGGLGDWAYHRWVTQCLIGRTERNCELLALAGGGVPMFGLMAAASLSRQPLHFLLPVLVVLLFTVTLICYDEFVFHRRRCGRLETCLHRLLVFGNGFAWLAWAHWCFVRGGAFA